MKDQISRIASLLAQPDPNPDKALVLLTPLAQQKQSHWPVFHYIGIAYLYKKEFDTALIWLRKSLDTGGSEPITYHALSVCHYNLTAFDKAVKFSRKALKGESFYKGWVHLAKVYRAQAKLKDALQCYKRAAELEPDNTELAHKIAEIYRDQGRLNKALELFEYSVKNTEDNHAVYAAIAQVLIKKGRFEEAKDYLDTILEKKPENAAARIILADLYRQQGNYAKAIDLCELLLEENPDAAKVRVNYAVCLQELGRLDEAEHHYMQALQDDPDEYQCLSNYLMCLHYNPKRSKQEIYDAHKLWDQHFGPAQQPTRPVPSNRNKNKPLRIGLFSGGFKRHPVGWMITRGLEMLPQGQFEIYCYTTNNKYDQITQRINQVADKWRSVIGYNDDIIARMIREDQIDILIELSGHAADNRLRTIVLEPAPIITKWVGGLFNTTGLQSVDYLITDQYESPEGEEKFYTEKLVRMPDDYICYLPPDYAPNIGPLPVDKKGYITFGCFNNPSKVNREILARWAQIMNRLPDSRLFLKSKQYDTETFKRQIINTMEKAGISEQRLIFRGESSHQDHLACYNMVDIALDPWPYSGGLTTCEALWMGVPVITKPGPTFAGRHSTTHLNNAGFSEWVVDSWDEYTDKTIALAKEPNRLAELRQSMRTQVTNSPLCDGPKFGAHLSVALRSMWEQWVDGYNKNKRNWQDHIDVRTLSEEEINNYTTKVEKVNGKTGDKENNKSDKADEKKEPITTIHTSPKQKSMHSTATENGLQNITSSFNEKNPVGQEVFHIETKDDVTICTPPDLNMLTPYVLLEQEEWFEPELNFIRQYVQPGMNVVDVGAGFGGYALPIANLIGNKGTVYAFEPGSVARQHLETSKVENRLHNLKITGRALSDQTGEASWQTAETPELNKINEAGTEKVSMTALDAWWIFENYPNIDLIKIDVNGDEHNVLTGTEELLEKENPVLLIAIGETDNGEVNQLEQYLQDRRYRLYEFIPGPELFAEYDIEAGSDPYLMNLIAIHENKKEELLKDGWIFDDSVKIEATDQYQWKETLGKQPWAKSKMDTWADNIKSGSYNEYIEALNLVCGAEQIGVSEKDPKSRSRKGAMMLAAAQKLIDLFNRGNAGIAAAMTYVRVMSQLGKRIQAVEMMKQLMETINSSQNISVDLPFLLPLPEQDNTKIQTDFSKWLTVRVVEAWISLQNPTTYMAGEQERGMLEALEGNSEINGILKKSTCLMGSCNKETIDSKRNKWFWYKNDSIKKEIEKSLFSADFWNGKFTPKKAQKVVEFTGTFFDNEFEKEQLKEIVQETEDRLFQVADDNVAFFIQVQALLALNDHETNAEISKGLSNALVSKGWEHKKMLYNYWYDKIIENEVIKEPKVSAIIISNRFKEKTVENLKRLNEQLEERGEIIFVNNGKKDKAFAPLQEYIDTYIRLKRNSGAYLARNFGALFAKGNLLLFVDDDGIPDEEMVQAHLDAHTEQDIIVSRGACYSDNPSNDPWHYDLGDEKQPAVTYLEGNTVYKTEVFYKAGGWGDYILFGHGGMEFSFRLLAIDSDKGKQIYIPDARLNHDFYRGEKQKINKAKKQKASFLLLNSLHDNLSSELKKWGSVTKLDLNITTPSDIKHVKFKEKKSKETISIKIPEKEVHRIYNIFERNEYSLPKRKKLGDKLTVVDVGANVGVFALYANLFAKNVEVFCFEPNPQVWPLLKENTCHFSNIHIYNKALGKKSGELTLNQHPRNTGQTSTTFNFEGGNSVKVPVEKGTEVLMEQEIDTIDVLKIDTEGAEVEILEGLIDYLPKTKVVMAEFHKESHRKKIEEYLSDFILYSAEVQDLRGIGTVKYANLNFFTETG